MPSDLAAPLPLSASDRPTVSEPPCRALRDLVAALGAACELPQEMMARHMSAALERAAADPELLTAQQRAGSAEAYRRHILAADPDGRFTIVALVWWPGQRSPVHAHHTWCGYAVVDGTLTETLYDWQACVSVAATHERRPGAISFTAAGRGGTHALGNAGSAPAVSLHVYGVAPECVSTHVNECVPVAELSR
jgi:predicted metal-dependent enzyme (double-stranded beta helix superfamily)